MENNYLDKAYYTFLCKLAKVNSHTSKIMVFKEFGTLPLSF